MLNESEIPKSITSELGSPGKTWINSLISGIFKASSEGNLSMDDEILNIMNNLREFMLKKYISEMKQERKEQKLKKLLKN